MAFMQFFFFFFENFLKIFFLDKFLDKVLVRGSLPRTSTSLPFPIFESLVPVLVAISDVLVFVHGFHAWWANIWDKTKSPRSPDSGKNPKNLWNLSYQSYFVELGLPRFFYISDFVRTVNHRYDSCGIDMTHESCPKILKWTIGSVSQVKWPQHTHLLFFTLSSNGIKIHDQLKKVINRVRYEKWIDFIFYI